MKAVSRFEHKLLRLLHCFLGRIPPDQVKPDHLERFDRPPCLSRDAVELVKDALAKGSVVLLARSGGWRRERFLRDDRARLGRLWERTPPEQLGLTFGGCTLDFLMWVAALKPFGDKTAWQPKDQPTTGDLFLLARAYGAIREWDSAKTLRKMPPIAHNGLCRLLHVGDFVGKETADPVDFTPWMTEPGSCVLEALQAELARSWLAVERAKERITDWQKLRRLGQAQEQILDGFLNAVEQASRRDLARFLLVTLAEVLGPNAQPGDWVGGLLTRGPSMADREKTYREALALVRQMDRFRAWQRQARLDGPMDEGFHSSQLWLADWERFAGDTLHRRAQDVIRQLDPMRQP